MITLQHHLKLGPNFSRSKFCDAKLTTKYGAGCISVHRNILAAVSTKLEKRFEENLDNSEPIVIKNVDFDVLDKIIKYVYSGEVSVGTDTEYEDFCDGISLLKIDVGKEVKISPVVNQHASASKVAVKTEYIEDEEEVIAKIPVVKHRTKLSVSEASSNSCGSVNHKRKCSSGDQECSEGSISKRNCISTSGDINGNQLTPTKEGTGVCHRKKDPSIIDNDIQVVDVKEVVELFLQEVPLRTSKNQISKYFSSFGEVQEVDLMDALYGRNSGLAVVKIVVDEQQKKELSELRHEIKRSYVKVFFKQDLISNDQLDKRFGDNRSKLRLRGIGKAVTKKAIKDFFGRKNIREVFLKGKDGFVEFENFSVANGWNGATVKVSKYSIKVYRSWKDSSRSKQWSGRRRRDNSRSPIRLGSRSRSKSRSRTGSTREDRLPAKCPW